MRVGVPEAGPGGHGVALDDGVGVFAQDAGAGQGEKDFAGVNFINPMRTSSNS